MKHLHKTFFLFSLFFTVFAFTACNKSSESFAYTDFQRNRGGEGLQYLSLNYDDSDFITSNSTTWGGSGFNPESPAGIESYTPPAYRDMDNMNGRMRQETTTANEEISRRDFRHAPTPTSSSSGSGIDPALNTEVERIIQNRMLTKWADLRLRVEDMTETEIIVSGLMIKYGAWSESSSISDSSLNFQIRVPSNFYNDMINELAELGKVLTRSERAEDVTLRYFDMESQLETRRELIRTFQGYLARARNIDEIMTVENRIANLQREINQTGTQLRNLANLVDYSTISLIVTGSAVITPVPLYPKPTLGERLGNLFGSFGNAFSSTLVVLIGIIIYGIPAVLIFIFAYWLLFGRLGLLKKLMFFAMGKKSKKES